MDRLRWMGLGGLALVLTFALMTGGWLRHWIDVPSVLLVVLGTPLVWCMTAGSDVATALQWVRGRARSAAEVDRAQLSLRSLRRAAWQVGGLGAALSLLPVLWRLHTEPLPDFVLGSAAFCLLYVGLADLVVIQPTLHRLEAHRAALRSAPGLDADHRVQLEAALDQLRALRDRQEARLGARD